MAEKSIVPTHEQQAHAQLAEHDIVETINRLLREGIDPIVVIAAIGAATADTITSVFGATAVAPWFEKQGEIMRGLQRPN